MRLVSPSRTAPLAAALLALLLLLAGCGMVAVREISANPEHLTLSDVTTSRSARLAYTGPAGSTLTVNATVSDERFYVSPATFTIAAGTTVTVTVGVEATPTAARLAANVRFRGAGVDDAVVTVSLEPGCFIDPDGPLPDSLASPAATDLQHALDHVPGELLVSYHAFPAGRAALGEREAAARALVASDVASTAGVEILRLGAAGEHDLVAVPEDDLAAATARLRADPRVEHVSRNYVAQRLSLPDRHYDAQWYLRDFGLEAAWAVEDAGGSGDQVVIAIVDDGLNVDHVDFGGKLLPGRDVYCADDDVRAISDHGTHVAGIAAARSHRDGLVVGVAKGPRARVVSVKVFPDRTDIGGTLDSVIRGMRWAAQLATGDGAAANPNRADVINLSLGFDTSLSASAIGLLQSTVDAIAARGIVLVAAAGNAGIGGGVTYPARLRHVVAVGSVDWELTRSSFSNYGIGLDLMAPGGTAPLAASTDAVCRSGGRHGMVGAAADGPRSVVCLAGTSMAAPFVAGTAALLIAADPGTYRDDPLAIVERLVATALQPEAIYDPAQHGHGIVCPDTALGRDTACTLPVANGALARPR